MATFLFSDIQHDNQKLRDGIGFTIGKYILLAMFIINFLFMAWSIISGSAIFLWVGVLMNFPILVFFKLYFSTKKLSEQRRLYHLAEIVEKIAESLRRNSLNLDDYNKYFEDIDSIKLSPISMFLWSTIVFIRQTRGILIQEQKEYINSTTNNTGEFQYREFSQIYSKIADALRRTDRVSVFDYFGEFYALAAFQWNKRKNAISTNSERMSPDLFINKCESISDNLKLRLFSYADEDSTELLSLIRNQDITLNATSVFGWQFLIGYWIWVRISSIKATMAEQPRRFWMGSSKLLSNQIRAVIIYYKKNDFTGVVDIIINGFDTRLKIPNLLNNDNSLPRY